MPNVKNMDFSTDGISWTSASVNVSLFPDEKIFEQGVVENDITSIDNTNYIWGAVGKNGLILKSSQLNDSLGTFNPVYNKHTQLWNNITTSSNFGTGFIQSVSHGNGLWVAVAGAGQIRSSTDAITWTTQNSNFGTSDIISVAYGNGLWVIGGVQGQLRTSTDAITWTTRTSNFGTTAIQSVSYSNGLWVAGGQVGQLRTSTQFNNNFKSYFIGADYA